MSGLRASSRPLGAPRARRYGLSEGFAVELDRDAHVSRNGRLVFGGSPQRLLRLSASAAAMLAPGGFTVRDTTTARLARTLLDGGVVHPRPGPVETVDVTIVIPVRDRAGMVDRLLRALRADPQTRGVPVVVVDDGSTDRSRLCAVAEEHRAVLVRHETSRGPAAARNTGLRTATTEFVAFCDSDVVPNAGWLSRLSSHFADGTVGLVAPRIVALPSTERGLLGRFDAECSPLDLGDREAPIVPMSKVAYVPSAALMVRTRAVGGGFDEDLQVAEDVDLCLRLHETGWRMLYIPEAHVAHEHRTDTASWLWQRGYYGTGAALLSLRHPGQVPPMYVAPWSLLACAVAVSGRRTGALAATAVIAVSVVRLTRTMPDADTPWSAATRLSLAAVRSTAQQLTRAATRHHWPLALLLAVFSRRARRTLLACSVVDALLERREKSSRMGLVRYVTLRRLDDVAYGTGVWWGALRARTVAPLLPRISTRRTTGPRRPPTSSATPS